MLFVEVRGKEVSQKDGPNNYEGPDVGMQREWHYANVSKPSLAVKA